MSRGENLQPPPRFLYSRHAPHAAHILAELALDFPAHLRQFIRQDSHADQGGSDQCFTRLKRSHRAGERWPCSTTVRIGCFTWGVPPRKTVPILPRRFLKSSTTSSATTCAPSRCTAGTAPLTPAAGCTRR